MAEKVTTSWQERSYTYSFHLEQEYEEIANFLQVAAHLLKNRRELYVKTELPVITAKADIPYSEWKNVSGWKFPLPMGVLTQHPRNSNVRLVIIQEGLYENGRYKEFIGVMAHELVHAFSPGAGERQVQKRAIKLLEKIIEHDLAEDHRAIDEASEELDINRGIRPLEDKAAEGGIEFLRFCLDNIKYFQQ
jgi:hypothetical protein